MYSGAPDCIAGGAGIPDGGVPVRQAAHRHSAEEAQARKVFLQISGATRHNLKKLNVNIPLGVFACLTGVSGSGKSTLAHDVVYLNALVAKGGVRGGACTREVRQGAGSCLMKW